MNITLILTFAAGVWIGTRVKPAWEQLKLGINSIALMMADKTKNDKAKEVQ